MARLELRLFGGLEATLDGALITSFESTKVRALLAYLAAEADRPQSREALAGLLWPDWPQQSAMRNLRNTLADLRQNLGDREAQPPYLLISRDSLQLNREADLWVDIVEFEANISDQGIGEKGSATGDQRSVSIIPQSEANGSLIRNLPFAISLYRGPFLDGFPTTDSPPFEEWVLAKREYFSQQMLKALGRLTEGSLEQGEYEQAEGYARRQIELEPWREPAYQQLMTALSLRGERAQALALYETCRKALADELDAEPSAETRRLYQAIREEKIEPKTSQKPELESAPLQRQPQPVLPTGTVTFLFTDIEGSTPLWERDAEAMKEAVARHHAILRQAVAQHGGHVFKVIGDEFQTSFEEPAQALQAALAAQRRLRDERWGSTGPLKVRMGLHSGPAEVIQGLQGSPDYAASHTINRVARIRSAAHGGQVLLSAATRELLHGYQPQEIHLRDLGEVYLKGMSLPEQLYQVVVADLPAEFPPLLTLSHPLHNLPLQLTSFIGREKEIAAVKGLLQSARLVTLTGPGGTGKTRLALQTSSGLVEQYADGVWLVELAPVVDPALVPTMAARALGLRELPGPQAISLLQEYLEQRQVLLILDNCEHVIEACIGLAEALLQTCPKLSFLVSSREALGIAGEVPFRVPPMTLPEATQSQTIEELGQSEAIRLFVERAATISPGFALTLANAPAILQVCQRLDGIPLAIELAAARVKLLPVEEIAGRLDDRFRLLTGGSRAALPRYQTLRACIDWSYVSLSEAERTLLQRLSVFAGGWVLEAAEAVGCGDAIQSGDVLELLGLLVDKSLIQTGNSVAGLYRFRMLETIRQYAHEKLVESGQAEATRDRHLQYYLELVERVGEKIRGPDEAQILDRLEAELDNLRLALAWSLEGRGRPGWNPEPGLRLAAALHWFWHCRGQNEEGLHWLEQVLAAEAEERRSKPLSLERAHCRVRALQWAAWSAGLTGESAKARIFDLEISKLYRSLREYGKIEYAYGIFSLGSERILSTTEELRLLDEAQAIFQEAGDQFGMTFCIHRRGHIARFHKDYERAKAYYEQEMALHKEHGDLDGVAGDLMFLSFTNYNQGNLEQARALCQESMRLFSEIHNVSYGGFQYLNLCEFDMLAGDYAQAAAHAKEGLSIGRRQGDFGLIRDGLLYLGRLALNQGNVHEAAERFEESLAYFRKKDHKRDIAESLYHLGLLAWNVREFEKACSMYTDALNNSRGRGDIYNEVGLLCELGKVALARGELSQAQAQFKQVFNTHVPFPLFDWEERNPSMLTLEATALLTAAQGKSEPAARLLGATEAWHTMIQNTRTPRERQEREACVTRLRTDLGEQAFAAAFAEGQAMTEEQAIQLAKEAIDF